MNSFHNLPSSRQWEKIGVRSRNGIALPLFSLRTETNFGIGEFPDLIPLIDWCSEVGFEVIQLLPLNDSGTDPSPYNALSSCALHPIYLSLTQIPSMEGAPLPKLPDASHLNLLPRLAYLEVLALKLNFLREYVSQLSQDLRQSKGFLQFQDKTPWLKPYCLFKVLKDELHHTPWMSWPKELREPDFRYLEQQYHDKIFFYAWVQYLAHLQLLAAKEYAATRKILLKGDIPILISPDSVDAWTRPYLFNFSLSAGAPPDAYNQQGQCWGFPPFNWNTLQAHHFDWWRERLQTASQYYDLYRIDHVVGLFRIWAIPLQHSAQDGFFFPDNDPTLFLPRGHTILQVLLDSSDMLPIAEDLGTVPPSIRETLMKMGICGTRVMRWEREYDKGGSFIPFDRYPVLSMSTVSTHDSETLQMWWQNHPDEAQALCSMTQWTYAPSISFNQRMEILRASHKTPSLFHINLIQEYLALFPELVSQDPHDERLNIPGIISKTNWTYRIKKPLETIMRYKPLKEAIANILSYKIK